jgi:hypothetical protein
MAMTREVLIIQKIVFAKDQSIKSSVKLQRFYSIEKPKRIQRTAVAKSPKLNKLKVDYAQYYYA